MVTLTGNTSLRDFQDFYHYKDLTIINNSVTDPAVGPVGIPVAKYRKNIL